MIDYRDINYLCHHGVKGQKWGVRKDEEPKHRREINVKITPKIAIASGTAFLAAGGATLLARKIFKGNAVSGGYVVEKGVKGIHYTIDVGKTITTALVAGGVGALTVTSAANIIKKKKDGDK